MKVVMLSAIVALLLVFGRTAHAHDHTNAQVAPPWWILHLESETEFVLTRPVVGQVFNGEVGARVSNHLFLTVSALLHVGDAIHVGGGVGLRYESPMFETMVRATFDHRIATFPQNAIRLEVRSTWWAHRHFGLMGRVLGENFPSPLNTENGGEWDFVASAGAVARWNHHFTLGVLATYRLPDVTSVRHAHPEAEPGLLIFAEFAVP